MISDATRVAIHTLAEQAVPLREISRLLKVSRNTVRRVLRQPSTARVRTRGPDRELEAIIHTVFERCQGNVVRVQEVLRDEYHQELSYSTLTRWIRQAGLRQPKPEPGSIRLSRAKKCNTIPRRCGCVWANACSRSSVRRWC